jgi:SAM-dependent methyltransferase
VPTTLGQTLKILANPEAPHLEHLCFTDFASFQEHLHRTQPEWERQVQQSLRLLALNGVIDPFTGQHRPAASLQLMGSNYRESLQYEGCLSRHRAVLLLIRGLMIEQRIPSAEELDLYCPEAITPFATKLRQLFPRFLGSEYLPDPADPQRQNFNHQDLCRLTLDDGCVDLVVCNELFEHLYDLPAALAEIARILRPDGYLISTFPFAYNSSDTIVKARHRPGSQPGRASETDLLTEAEYHGDPVHPERGSLVYQIPGWDILDQARRAGLSDPLIHWIASPSYGIVGQELPAVMVLVARRG